MKAVNENDFKNETVTGVLDKITEKSEQLSELAFEELPVFRMFDELSIPFKFSDRPLYQYPTEQLTEYERNLTFNVAIEATVKGLMRNGSQSAGKMSQLQDRNPIESIVSKYGRFSPRKCFTFFSDFRRDWTETNIRIESFEFSINHDKNWFPRSPDHKNFRYYFSMHAPNILPLMDYENNYLELKPGYSYSISFSRIRTKLLPPSYITNCRDYSTSNSDEEQSQIDCIDKCVLKSLIEKCGNCIHNIGALFRKEFLEKYSSEKICKYSEESEFSNCYFENIGEIHPNCRSNCRSDCDNQYLDFNIDNKQKLETSSWDGRAFVHISHNRLPDQEIRHMPEITFVSYLSCFGGLAGMWLGFSVYALYKLFEKLI
jgi:hypothetical protein